MQICPLCEKYTLEITNGYRKECLSNDCSCVFPVDAEELKALKLHEKVLSKAIMRGSNHTDTNQLRVLRRQYRYELVCSMEGDESWEEYSRLLSEAKRSGQFGPVRMA